MLEAHASVIPVPPTATDADLLRHYADGGSQAAFAELVRRHVDWVFSAALRAVRDRHLAEDVTQAVFIILARKARSLRDRPALSPWLFNVTRYASARALRAEARRRRHERRAAAMSTATGRDRDRQGDADWEQLSAAVDELVWRLGADDRDAVLLRFYERKSFADVGAALRVSEEAARKRVTRAVDKLRALFERRGLAVSSDALGAALLAHATQPAGATVVASAESAAASLAPGAALGTGTGTGVATGAGTGTAAAAPAVAIAKGAVAVMTLNKVLVSAACGGTLLLAGGLVLWSQAGASSGAARAQGGSPATAAAAPPSSTAPAAPKQPVEEGLPQYTFAKPDKFLEPVPAAEGGGPGAPVREGDMLELVLEDQARPGRRNRYGLIVQNGSINLPYLNAPLAVRDLTVAQVGPAVTSAVAATGTTTLAFVNVEKVRWAFDPAAGPDPAIAARERGDAVIPMVMATRTNKRDPDVVKKGLLGGRTWEEFGFMRFDFSGLKSPPRKATLHAACYLLENTRGRRTPARLVFYLVKTDWDDTANHRFAKSSERIPWGEGPDVPLNPNSPLNVDPTPVASIEMPNPPPPGYNVSFDVTEVVADWVTGKQPNYGLMLRVDQAPGYSYQANLGSFDYMKDKIPKIVCEVGPRPEAQKSNQ